MSCKSAKIEPLFKGIFFWFITQKFKSSIGRQCMLPNCDKLPSPTSGSEEKLYWPALCFKAAVDKVGFKSAKQQLVELLVDKYLQLVDNTQLQSYRYEDTSLLSQAHKCDELKHESIEWQEYQACQNILLTTPTVLFGYCIKVYHAECTTHWYTAVIHYLTMMTTIRN